MEKETVRVDVSNATNLPVRLRFDGKDLKPIEPGQLSPFLPLDHTIYNLTFRYRQGSFTDIPKWHLLVALTAGGLFIGLLYPLLKLSRGHGPADAIIARLKNDGFIPLREGLSTAIVCVSSIGLGASVGRFGPAVHLGATLGSAFGRAFNLSRTTTITCLGCGVASAIATSFNTPIAAVIFAHETIIGHYSLRAFAPITISAVAGNAVAIHHGRLFDGFQNLTAPAELTLQQYPLFVLVGLISAFFALAYMHSLVIVGKLASKSKIPLWLRPALAGLAIGIVAIWLPNLLGLVEETTAQVIQDQGREYVLELLCILIVLKIAATALCLGYGMHGGVFGPALCIGAMVGATISLAYDPAYYSIFSLAGMGACISSVIGAPITTILIVFELNQNYSVATAVMIAVVISNLITNRLFARSFFLFQVKILGFDINAGREVMILQRRTIGEIMETSPHRIAPDAHLAEVEKALRARPHADLYVTDSDQILLGFITLASGWDALARGHEQSARELARMPEHILTEDTNLKRGFEVIEGFVGVSIPVIEDTNSMRLTGIIHKANIIQAYNDAVRTARREEQDQA